MSPTPKQRTYRYRWSAFNVVLFTKAPTGTIDVPIMCLNLAAESVLRILKLCLCVASRRACNLGNDLIGLLEFFAVDDCGGAAGADCNKGNAGEDPRRQLLF